MKKQSAHRWVLILALAGLVLCVGAAVLAFSVPPKPLFTGSVQLSQAQTPPAHEDRDRYTLSAEEEAFWSSQAEAFEDFSETLPACYEALGPFIRESSREILSQDIIDRKYGELDGNRVYSPLNLYMALSMAAEITGGDTREEILRLLGSSQVEELREQSKGLWLSHSLPSGSELRLSNSIWLNNTIDFKEPTLDILAQDHFADSFRGEMGSEELDKMLRDWMNGKTENVLEESIDGLSLNRETILALVSTVYYHGGWISEFDPAETKTETFHSLTGDMDRDFMHDRFVSSYYRGDSFACAGKALGSGEEMYFFLPDEDSSVEELLKGSSDFWDFLQWDMKLRGSNGPWTPWKQEWPNSYINLSVPKFDVQSELDLSESLQALGLQRIFDPRGSDFSPLMENRIPAMLSEVRHGARVTIDEKGCTAASYVTMAFGAGAAPEPKNEFDLCLDRPFVFLIQSRRGMPLFLGVVQEP